MKPLDDAIYCRSTKGIRWPMAFNDGDEVWDIIRTIKDGVRE